MKKFMALIGILNWLIWGGIALAATVAGDPLLNPLLVEEIEGTDKAGNTGVLLQGTAGTSTYAAVWDASGNLVDGPGVPAVINLSNIASTAIPVSLISDTACTDDLGTEAIPWQTAYLTTYLYFEGATDNDYQTIFTITDPTTADRTITVPDSDQTIGTATSCAADAVDAITEVAAALKTGSDTKFVTGTAGTTGNFAQWNGDGDLVDGGEPGTPGSFGAAGTPTADVSGVVAAGTTNWLLIDGNGGTDDDIVELTCNALGDIIIVQAVDNTTTITMKDGAYLKLQADFIMDNGADIMGLLVTTLGDNDVCTELFRANNGA